MTSNAIIEQSVLSTAILPIASALRKHGFDPIEIMEEAGIDAAKIARPDWRVPLADFDGLLQRCLEVTHDEAFGLYAGEEVQPQVLHGLGLGWLASDSVYDGLSRLVRFCKMISSVAELRMIESQDFVQLQLPGTDLSGPSCYARRDFGVALVVRMCQLNLGEFLSPVKVELERPTPTDPERWESLLASKVIFDCKSTSIYWSRSDIQEKLVTGDPALARINDEHAEAYIDTFLTHAISRSVVRKIISRLPDGPPDQDQIASDLAVSNRTLQRKLKEEGTSYNALLQETRMNLARKYLAQRQRSIVEVSYLLGFSEPSAFSRAFKRWTGESPARYQTTSNTVATSAKNIPQNSRQFAPQGNVVSPSPVPC